MKKYFLSTFILLISLFSGKDELYAQTATSTPGPTPNCCQTDPGWTNPTLGDAAGVAVDMTRHRVYIVDRGTGALNAYDYNGAAVSAFGTNGTVSNAGAFYVAMGSCAYDGVYVVQRSNPTGEAVKYNANGIKVWNSVNLGGGANRYIYVDDAGLVYVTDDFGKIYILDSAGTLRNILTGYAFNTPTGLFKTGSTLFVADSINNRIVSLPQTGAYTYGSLSVVVPSVPQPIGITTDLNGNYYVASNSFLGFYVYDSSWSLLSSCSNGLFQSPYGIALDETGSIYIALQLIKKTVIKLQSCFTQPSLGPCLTPAPSPTPSYPGADPPVVGQCFIYPSPVRGDHATVSYNMAESGKVELKVWNEKAELVAEITDQKTAAVQVTSFHLSGFASGVYFYRLTLAYDSGKVESIGPQKFAVIH